MGQLSLKKVILSGFGCLLGLLYWQPALADYQCMVGQYSISSTDQGSSIDPYVVLFNYVRVPCGAAIFENYKNQGNGVINGTPGYSSTVAFFYDGDPSSALCLSQNGSNLLVNSCPAAASGPFYYGNFHYYQLTLSNSNNGVRLSYGCKNAQDMIVDCALGAATQFYDTANPMQCYIPDTNDLGLSPSACAVVSANTQLVCSVGGTPINCSQAPGFELTQGQQVTYQTLVPPDMNTCDPTTQNCPPPAGSNLVVPSGNMRPLPKSTYGLPSGSSVGSVTAQSDVADAILYQTSYLARMLLQANDVFPPSHVSARLAGEWYASVQDPAQTNLQTLDTQMNIRNNLGALAISGSPPGPFTQSAVMQDWVNYHLKAYCDPEAQQAGLTECQPVLGLPAQQQQAVYAMDTRATSLFGDTVANPEAALRYLVNVTNVLPSLTDNTSQQYGITSNLIAQSGQLTYLTPAAYIALIATMEEQSKISLSQYYFLKLFSERLSLDNVKIPVTSWTSPDGVSPPVKNTTYQNTSQHGLLKFEAAKRFMDPGWYDRIQQMPTPGLLKEIAYMMALQLNVDFKRYETEEMQTAFMAMLAADSARMGKQMRVAAGQDSSQVGNNALNSATGALGAASYPTFP